ncbi:unnamed protein product [Ilex paraguariensis]|uniref:Uncharacterized protein n=1 Tax=Ilex paraguariensis TaxID=185542 RepID=A0ABC8TSP8_9AQUA
MFARRSIRVECPLFIVVFLGSRVIATFEERQCLGIFAPLRDAEFCAHMQIIEDSRILQSWVRGVSIEMIPEMIAPTDVPQYALDLVAFDLKRENSVGCMASDVS